MHYVDNGGENRGRNYKEARFGEHREGQGGGEGHPGQASAGQWGHQANQHLTGESQIEADSEGERRRGQDCRIRQTQGWDTQDAQNERGAQILVSLLYYYFKNHYCNFYICK